MNPNIDSYKLIAAVSKRPALYDKSHKMYYCHNKFKKRLWKETCAEVYPDWERMPSHERIECGREVQKRWKNLRTCFTREVALQHKEDQDRREGREVKPRKVYEYYNRMRYMLTNEQRAKLQAIQNDALNGDDVTDDPLDNVKSEFQQESYDKEHAYDDDNIMVIEEERYNASEGINEDRRVSEKPTDDDEDKHFLLSLLRTFRQFDDKQKLDAKIEILKALRKIRFPDN